MALPAVLSILRDVRPDPGNATVVPSATMVYLQKLRQLPLAADRRSQARGRAALALSQRYVGRQECDERTGIGYA